MIQSPRQHDYEQLAVSDVGAMHHVLLARAEETKPQPQPSDPAHGIDLAFFRSLAQLLRQASAVEANPTVAASLARRLRPYLVPLLLVSVQVYNMAGFLSVLVPSLFYGALTSGSEDAGSNASAGDAIDAEQLKEALKSATLYLSLTVVAKAVMALITEFTALQWRESLTQQLLSDYLQHSSFYHLISSWPGLDNPDQRLSREIAQFSTLSADIISTVFQAGFNIFYYSYKMHLLTDSFFGPGAPSPIHSPPPISQSRKPHSGSSAACLTQG